MIVVSCSLKQWLVLNFVSWYHLVELEKEKETVQHKSVFPLRGKVWGSYTGILTGKPISCTSIKFSSAEILQALNAKNETPF